MPYSQAITTCARAAEYRPPPQLGIHLNKDKDVGSEVKLLPEELFVALECCLDDLSDQVKRAAAITLYTLERPIPKVTFQLLQSHPDSQIVYVFVFSLCLCTSLSLYIFVFVHLCLCTSLSLYIFVFVHLCPDFHQIWTRSPSNSHLEYMQGLYLGVFSKQSFPGQTLEFIC